MLLRSSGITTCVDSEAPEYRLSNKTYIRKLCKRIKYSPHIVIPLAKNKIHYFKISMNLPQYLCGYSLPRIWSVGTLIPFVFLRSSHYLHGLETVTINCS